MTATSGAMDGSTPNDSGNPLLHTIALSGAQRVAVALVFVLCSILWQIPPRDEWFLFLVLLVGFASLFVAVRGPAKRGATARGRSRSVALLLLLAVVLNAGYEVCPHARYASLGPAIATIGGKPCHNPRHPHTIVTWLAGVRSVWWN